MTVLFTSSPILQPNNNRNSALNDVELYELYAPMVQQTHAMSIQTVPTEKKPKKNRKKGKQNTKSNVSVKNLTSIALGCCFLCQFALHRKKTFLLVYFLFCFGVLVVRLSFNPKIATKSNKLKKKWLLLLWFYEKLRKKHVIFHQIFFCLGYEFKVYYF